MDEQNGNKPAEPSPETRKYPNGPTWRDTFDLIAGKLSDADQEEYRIARDIKNEKEDIQRCEQHRAHLLKRSPVIRFMREKVAQLNGSIDESNIRCCRCTHRAGGGFSPDAGIRICANEIINRKHMEDTLSHELIHAYDHLRFKVDFENLRHAACAEIRASSLSGECRFMQEFFTRGQFKVSQQHQECVRRRAVISVTNHPMCRDKAKAKKVVSEVWDSCFADTRPFDEIWR